MGYVCAYLTGSGKLPQRQDLRFAPSGKQRAKGSGEQKVEAWLAARVSRLALHLPPLYLHLRRATGLAGLGGEELELEPRDPLPANKGVCSEAGADKQSVWLLSCPHAHATDSGGRRLSQAVAPGTQPKSTGFGGQPGLGSSLRF